MQLHVDPALYLVLSHFLESSNGDKAKLNFTFEITSCDINVNLVLQVFITDFYFQKLKGKRDQANF